MLAVKDEDMDKTLSLRENLDMIYTCAVLLMCIH